MIMDTKEKYGFHRIKAAGLDYFKVAPGVWGMKVGFVNIYIICEEVDGQAVWVLLDAGLKGSARKIKRMAEHIFGEGALPSAIILTHGHFDHVGGLDELLDTWDVPVYAHYLELPYLKGISSYPPPDPMVGGGLMSLVAWLYPRKPKDLGKRIHRLNVTGEVPVLSEWKYIHVPGHSPGQIALFRDNDHVLLAGDAFVTTRQESVFSVVTQKQHVSGPPKYFTIDWDAAEHSINTLLALNPQVAATGHGYPMYGDELLSGLKSLSVNFRSEAVPHYGRYVKEAARTNKNGVQYIPRRVNNPFVLTGAVLAGSITVLGLFFKYHNRSASGG